VLKTEIAAEDLAELRRLAASYPAAAKVPETVAPRTV
jgi:hypothetical protein